jgi:hypothetical protein
MGTMDALDFPLGSFDAVVVIDSLYSCKDLTATIGQFLRILRTGGQMGLFYTHIVESSESSLAHVSGKPGERLFAFVLNWVELSKFEDIQD